MVSNFFKKSKKIFFSQQTSILSAASVIMVMIVVAQVFGMLRQWTVLRFFGNEGFALYLAAFRLPDLVFEVFAYGAFSSAFIPVFTKYIRKEEQKAWLIAARVINIGLIIFGIASLLFSLFAYQFYSVVAFGFDATQTDTVARLARIIFLAQGFFIVSYVITGVLESLKRFLVPALAPIFYNLGVILGTIFLSGSIGIYAPAVGAVIGAAIHLTIQLPLAFKLGFRFKRELKVDEGVAEVGRLASPRLLELVFLQVLKSAELFFCSLLSTVSYAFLNLASSIQAIPIMLFGVSLAKAALVSLAHEDDDEKFTKKFLATFYQMMFFIIPAVSVMIILRVPVVRLIYGTSHSLDWESTLQTGWVLSAFAIGIPFQGALALLSRAFYARHDTRTPVVLSIIDVFATILLEAIFVFVLHYPVWSIALANTLSIMIQVSLLYYLLAKKLNSGTIFSLKPVFKIVLASCVSGTVMFFILKFFDRSVWVKRLSFIGGLDLANLPFEKFVLDTRYTLNLLILTAVVSLIGMGVYIICLVIMRSKELQSFWQVLRTRKTSQQPAELLDTP